MTKDANNTLSQSIQIKKDQDINKGSEQIMQLSQASPRGRSTHFVLGPALTPMLFNASKSYRLNVPNNTEAIDRNRRR